MNGMGTHARKTRDVIVSSPLVDNPLLLAVAGIGFAVSFQTITREATAHGMPGWPQLYPIGIDIGILALVLEARKRIARGRSDIVPRVLAWGLTALTIYVNIHGSPATDWLGRVMHAVMPALWVVFLELTRSRQKVDVDVERELESIPVKRWFADWPWRVTGMKRRQIFSEVKSYRVMCAREEARILARSLARDVWGWQWRRKAPVMLREHLKHGTFPAEVAEAAATAAWGSMPAMDEPVEKWLTGLVKQATGAASRVKQQRRAVEASTAPPALPAGASAPVTPDMPVTRQSVTRGNTKGRKEAERLLREESAMTLQEIAAAAGVSLSTVNRVKADMPAQLRLAK
jgi:Protein of unknown function (DUF2637)